eukprot:10216769-Alexandrium_andersonii.AAC.1
MLVCCQRSATTRGATFGRLDRCVFQLLQFPCVACPKKDCAKDATDVPDELLQAPALRALMLLLRTCA